SFKCDGEVQQWACRTEAVHAIPVLVRSLKWLASSTRKELTDADPSICGGALEYVHK
ncbi:MAG: hypothetical protein ACI8Q9_002059, partial [Planctomycetota bacterium]